MLKTNPKTSTPCATSATISAPATASWHTGSGNIDDYSTLHAEVKGLKECITAHRENAPENFPPPSSGLGYDESDIAF